MQQFHSVYEASEAFRKTLGRVNERVSKRGQLLPNIRISWIGTGYDPIKLDLRFSEVGGTPMLCLNFYDGHPEEWTFCCNGALGRIYKPNGFFATKYDTLDDLVEAVVAKVDSFLERMHATA